MKLLVLGAATSPHVIARAQAMQRSGHDVFLVSPTEPVEVDFPAVFVPRGSGWLGRILQVVRLAMHINAYPAHAVHAHYAAEVTTWLGCLLRRKPLIITVMGGDVLFEEQPGLGWLGRNLTKWSLRSADLVTAKSKLLCERLVTLGVNRKRIENIVWGVESNIFHCRADTRLAVRKNWEVSSDAIVVFSPRMFRPLYNQDIMVEALSLIPEVTLVLSTYGKDANYMRDVMRKAQDLGVANRIRLQAGVDRPRMPHLYSASDIVLSLAASDGFPQTVLEAMACETPVILTNLERYREYFEHDQSALFVDLDARQVAQSLRRLIDEPIVGKRLVETAKEIVTDQCDIERSAERLNARLAYLVR